MPGWTGFPVGAWGDAQDASIWTQIIEALNERYAAVGGGAWTLPTAGDDGTSAGWLHSLQESVINLGTNNFFIKSHTAGGVMGGPEFDEATEGDRGLVPGNPTMYTEATLYAAAGLNANGFTRKWPREFATLAATTYLDGDSPVQDDLAKCRADDLVYMWNSGGWILAADGSMPDVATGYGHAQSGDYITPENVNELRAVLNVIVWAKEITGGWTWDTSRNDGTGISQGGGRSWNEAKTNADADYGASATVQYPQTWSNGDIFAGSGDFTARKVSESGTYKATTMQTTVACPLDFYCFVNIDNGLTVNGVFDANGSGLPESEWYLWDQLALDNSASRTSDMLGSGGNPAWCDSPDLTYMEAWRGWMLRSAVVIARFNVSGAFTYY